MFHGKRDLLLLPRRSWNAEQLVHPFRFRRRAHTHEATCSLRSRVEVALADLDKFPLPYKRINATRIADTGIDVISERFNKPSKKFKTLNRRFNKLPRNYYTYFTSTPFLRVFEHLLFLLKRCKLRILLPLDSNFLRLFLLSHRR